MGSSVVTARLRRYALIARATEPPDEPSMARRAGGTSLSLPPTGLCPWRRRGFTSRLAVTLTSSGWGLVEIDV